MNKLAPVVLFVYNRPIHTEKVILSLLENDLIKDTDLFVYSDGPKNHEQSLKVQKVRQLVHSFSGFKSITIIESTKNKGLSRSIIDGVTHVIDQYGKAIILEDDCVVSPFFLYYMNQALIFYDKNLNVGSISGYCPPINIPLHYNQDVILIPRICSWAWATWIDKWKTIDWLCSDFIVKNLNLHFARKFNQCGDDMFSRLCRELRVGAKSWATRFAYSHFTQGYSTIYPIYSYIYNIGQDGSGEHKKSSTFMNNDLHKSIQFPQLENVMIKPYFVKQFRKIYSGRMIGSIKRYCIAIYDIYFRMKK